MIHVTDYKTRYLCSSFKELGVYLVSDGKVLMVQRSKASIRIHVFQTMQPNVDTFQISRKSLLLKTMEVDTAVISLPRRVATTLFIRSVMITVKCFSVVMSILGKSGWLLIKEKRWRRRTKATVAGKVAYVLSLICFFPQATKVYWKFPFCTALQVEIVFTCQPIGQQKTIRWCARMLCLLLTWKSKW